MSSSTQHTGKGSSQDSIHHDQLLDALALLHDFCTDHNLHYYLIGGALIGAIRHRGFIPWDNDVDIAMPRSDYDRLIAMRAELPHGLSISVPFVDKGYNNTKARVYTDALQIQENFLKPFTIGPWIDIFPLDNTFDAAALRWLHFKAVFILKHLCACRLGGIVVTGTTKGRIKHALHYLLLPCPAHYLGKLFNLAIRIKRTPGKYVGNLMGRWQQRELMERQELESARTYPFEQLHLTSFFNPDLWLRRVYGDYMKPPPPNKRTPDHDYIVLEKN